MFWQFETSKGSIYHVVNENKTRRWKAIELELKEISDMTIYIDSHFAYLVGCLIYFGAWIEVTENEVILFFDTKEVGRSEFLIEPKIDVCPLELWGNGECPERIHVGNKIVDVW